MEQQQRRYLRLSPVFQLKKSSIILRVGLSTPMGCAGRTGGVGVRLNASGLRRHYGSGRFTLRIRYGSRSTPSCLSRRSPFRPLLPTPGPSWPSPKRPGDTGLVVRRIVRRLGSELRREVRRAERSIRQGGEMSAVLGAQDGRLSPLGCFIVAQRAGRVELVDRFAAAAAAQHRSCPLYRSASLALIPADFYPDESLALEHQADTPPRTEKILLSLN